MSLRQLGRLLIAMFCRLRWAGEFYVVPPAMFDQAVPGAPETPPVQAAASERGWPGLGRETISGAPMTPVERELWADLLDQR